MKTTNIFLYDHENYQWVLMTAVSGHELQKRGISIGANVFLGEHVKISNKVVIHDDAKIGAGSLLHEHVIIRESATIGKNTVINSHVTVGSCASVDDNCTIHRGCQIYYGASINANVSLGEDVYVKNNARINCNVIVCTRTTVGPRACVGRNSCIGKDSHIGGGATISAQSVIGDHAVIAANSRPNCVLFTGSQHKVAYWGEDKIQIGCEVHSIEDWQRIYTTIGERHDYTPQQVNEYSLYIQTIATLHKAYQAL